jgi:hypothetical protein
MAHDEDKEVDVDYRVVTAENKVERLVKDVNKLMDSGWEPLGGVSVSHAYDVEDERITLVFAQALIKRR